MATVRDIMRKWLKENGYDGLFNGDYFCGCPIDDYFMTCKDDCPDCYPAYRHKNEHNQEVFCLLKEIREIENGHCIECKEECPIEDKGGKNE